MHEFLAVTQAVLPEKLRLPIIRIPATVLDPASQKVILSRNKIGIGSAREFDYLCYFPLQFGSHPLIGIETENPFMGTVGHGLVAERAEAREIDLIHLVGELLGDRRR